MRPFVLSLIIFLAAGCASNVSHYVYEELAKPLTCQGDQQCRIMWDRAIYFVNTNAGFKVQTANDNMIETYNPTGYSPKLAFRIIKQPLGNESYKIIASAWCDNLFGCMPNRLSAMAKAKKYIRSGVL